MKFIRRALLLLALLLLMGASLPEVHEVHLHFNGKDVKLEPSILEKDGILYLPMKAFSKLTSLQLTQRKGEEYVLFMDNIFIKFTLNSNTYFLNGKEFTWKSPPFVLYGDIYLPQRLLLDFMHFHYNYDGEKRLLDLTSTSSYDMTLSRVHNRQRAEFAEAKISYELPYFWKRTSINSFSSDEKGSMKIEVKSQSMGNMTLEERMAIAIAEKNTEGANKLPPKERFVGQRTIYTYGYSFKEESGYSYYGYSFFELENQFIETNFYGFASSPSLITKVEEDILNTLLSKAYAVDSLDEHYVELDAFFDENMKIDTLVYSNILTDNALYFAGSISPKVKEFQISVEKGKQRFIHTVPVMDGRFSTSIPIPFGLGFHHLSVYLTQSPVEESMGHLRLAEDRNLLLKTSVLNTSLDIALYTSASDQVQSNRPLIHLLSRDIDSTQLDYQKAKQALEIMKREFSTGNVETLEESFQTKKLSKETASQVYAALLRHMNIPTRILSNSAKTFYGVEILSNGNWLLCDPYSYLQEDGHASKFMSLDTHDYGKKMIYYDY